MGQYLIEYNETLPSSQGRRLRTYNMNIPPRTPKDCRKILHVHKPRVFFSDLSEENIGNCRTHHEFSIDKVISITGPHVNVRRQQEWERNRELDMSSCSNRGIPSYDILNALTESDPDLEQVDEEALDRMIKIPSFFASIPSKWELKASVKWVENAPPEDVYIGGWIRQRTHTIPEPFQPGDFPGYI